jgi:ApaG protein
MHKMSISTETEYLDEDSSSEQSRFTFAYTMTIRNHGESPVQLLRRHWIITDGNEEVQEVEGDGVVGLRPIIEPGDAFTYTSAAMIHTDVGTMHGSYFFIDANGKPFDVEIPAFRLANIMQLH